MEKVGFIGLGAMGSAMARNVRSGGYPLQVYNRSPERCEPFRADAVPVCDSPREVAGRSEVTILMVTNSAALDALINGPEGVAEGLTAGKVVINMSTVSPEATEAAAAAVEAKGAAFVDAPVSGTVKPAEEGTLVILAGADAGTLQKVTPLLKTMGRQVLHCGGVGQGTRMKLVLNLMLGNMMETLAEGMMLGRQFGLEPVQVLDALSGGAMNAPMFQVKGKAMLEGHYAGQFPVHLMFKDLNLVLEAAGQARMPLPQTAATRECFSAAMSRGLGNEDMAAVVKCLEILSGRHLRD